MGGGNTRLSVATVMKAHLLDKKTFTIGANGLPLLLAAFLFAAFWRSER